MDLGIGLGDVVGRDLLGGCEGRERQAEDLGVTPHSGAKPAAETWSATLRDGDCGGKKGGDGETSDGSGDATDDEDGPRKRRRKKRRRRRRNEDDTGEEN